MFESVDRPHKAEVVFGVLAAFFALFGVIYLVEPMASYHEGIIGMSAAEQAADYPDQHALVTTLVDVIGIAFLAVAGVIAAFGVRSTDDRLSYGALTYVFLVFTVPSVYVVYAGGGPVGLASIPLGLHVLGLGLAAWDREW